MRNGVNEERKPTSDEEIKVYESRIKKFIQEYASKV